MALAPDRFPGAALIGGVAPYPAEGLDWFEGMGPENVEEFQATLADPENSVRSAGATGPSGARSPAPRVLRRLAA